jgi:MFS family permease
MDLSQLTGLGKVGGVPGIALGAAALILGAVLGLTDAVPEAWRGPLLILVVLGAVCWAVLALAGWMRPSRADPQLARTEGDQSPARNEDASRTGGRQEATSRGKRSPATNIRR